MSLASSHSRCLQVEALLGEIEAVRKDMCERSQQHAERQSRLECIFLASTAV